MAYRIQVLAWNGRDEEYVVAAEHDSDASLDECERRAERIRFAETYAYAVCSGIGDPAEVRVIDGRSGDVLSQWEF